MKIDSPINWLAGIMNSSTIECLQLADSFINSTTAINLICANQLHSLLIRSYYCRSSHSFSFHQINMPPAKLNKQWRHDWLIEKKKEMASGSEFGLIGLNCCCSLNSFINFRINNGNGMNQTNNSSSQIYLSLLSVSFNY